MGVGDSLEAAFALSGPIPAGTWGLSLDGLVAGPNATFMVVRFELILRPMSGPGVVFLRLENRYLRDPQNRFGAVRLQVGPDSNMVFQEEPINLTATNFAVVGSYNTYSYGSVNMTLLGSTLRTVRWASLICGASAQLDSSCPVGPGIDATE